MALLGTVKEWDNLEEDWTHYIERVKFFFAANDVLTEGKKQAILLSVVGAKHYAVPRGFAENKLEEKTFKELCTLIERHIRPALNIIHERFLFNTRDKKKDASISEYMTLLRKMSEHCNFEEKVNKHIRDRLVVGVKDEKIQERLLGERTLTLEKAIEIAVSMESARKYSRLMLGTSTSKTVTLIHRLPDSGECYHCRSTTHLADRYHFRSKVCFKCRRTGHTRWKCRQEEDRSFSGASAHNKVKRRAVNKMDERHVEENKIVLEKLDLNTVAVLVELLINKKKVLMEVDIGVSCSVMSSSKFKEVGQLQELKESSVRLRTYTS